MTLNECPVCPSGSPPPVPRTLLMPHICTFQQWDQLRTKAMYQDASDKSLIIGLLKRWHGRMDVLVEQGFLLLKWHQQWVY